MGGPTLPHVRRSRALALALLLAATLLPATAARTDALPCPGYEVVPFQGPSCPVAGGWEVLLRDGTRLLTHGPDAAPADAAADASGGSSTAAAPPRPPACVADPATEYHNLLIYAVPSDRADRHADLAPTLRGLVNDTNARLNAEAALFSETASYRFACDADGLVLVAHARLPTPSGQASFSTIVDDLRALGFDGDLAKHWVWYDATMGNVGGQANVHDDDRLVVNNHNNFGGDYAVTYGHLSVRIMMHENGHNLGAVQRSAPDSSGGWHCNDGHDVMCYADGGPTSDYAVECGDREWFDCRHDSYFNPAPPEDSWLATHWNLAHRHNRFIDFSNRAPAAPTLSCVPFSPLVDEPTRCTFRVEDESPGVALTVDWGDGAVERVPAEGYVPPGLVDATHAWSRVGRHEIAAFAVDDGNPPLAGPAGGRAIDVRCGFDRAGTLPAGLRGIELESISARTETGLPAHCHERPYALAPSGFSSWRVCWRDADAHPLACSEEREGVVPPGAVEARVTLLDGTNARFALRVR